MIDVDIIKKEMERQEVTVYQLSKETGISQQTLHNVLEKGDMRVSHLTSICEKLGMDYTQTIPSIYSTVTGDNNTTMNSSSGITIGTDKPKRKKNSKKSERLEESLEQKNLAKEVQALERLLEERERLLAEKDRTIETYQQMIDMLTARLKNS